MVGVIDAEKSLRELRAGASCVAHEAQHDQANLRCKGSRGF